MIYLEKKLEAHLWKAILDNESPSDLNISGLSIGLPGD